MRRSAAAAALIAGLTACAPMPPMPATAAPAPETCLASVYWEGFGRPLADGKRHRATEVLAAHRTLPMGSRVRVTNLATGHTADIPIHDRGPYVRGRCIDLSLGAARALGVSGLARVRVEIIPPPHPALLLK